MSRELHFLRVSFRLCLCFSGWFPVLASFTVRYGVLCRSRFLLGHAVFHGWAQWHSWIFCVGWVGVPDPAHGVWAGFSDGLAAPSLSFAFASILCVVLRAALKPILEFFKSVPTLCHTQDRIGVLENLCLRFLLFVNSQVENMSLSLAWPSRACGAPLFWSRAAASWLAVPEVFCELPSAALFFVAHSLSSLHLLILGFNWCRKKEKKRQRETETERDRKRETEKERDRERERQRKGETEKE